MHHLQEAISHADGWNKQSNIDFNVSKCKVLTIPHRKSPIESKYHFGSTEQMRVNSEVDLRVTVTSKLSWNQHNTLNISKANNMLKLFTENLPRVNES